MKPLSDCRLYAFVDTAYLCGRAADRVAQQLCDGGADLLQLRAKGVAIKEVRRLALALRPITQAAGVGLVINDYPEIAAEAGADFCHLGQEDFFGAGFTRVEQARPNGSSFRIGLSTHGPEQAQRAVIGGADYVAIGPVFATATKPTAKPVSLEYVRWAAANLEVPWFAIGGITLENIDAVISAGATRVCVVSAILNARDVTACCRLFNSKIKHENQIRPKSW